MTYDGPYATEVSEALLGGSVVRTVLPSGLRVLTEEVPGVRSVAVGVWVGAGSRDESADEHGASHYLEHLLFKGTQRRSAYDISAGVECVGGELNAFTSREHTCYYARVLDVDLPLAVDTLADMVRNSLLREQDIEAERGVVLEEIAMHEDDPSDAVHDVFLRALLGDGALGRPVLGTVASIEALTRPALEAYYRRRYVAPETVVALAGALEHGTALELVAQAFAGDPAGEPAPVRRGRPRPRPAPHAGRSLEVVDRPTEQANVVLGTLGLSRHDPRRYALDLLSTALGEGMSSRLFQEVREKRGLAYSVYSFTSHYAETGLFGVYAGCTPKRVDEVLALCRELIEQAAREGLSADELERAKGQTRGELALGMEDTGSRMTRLGKGELAYGEVLGIDDVLARVDAVTVDDVAEVAAEVLGRPLGLGAVGPFEARDLAGVLQ